jgi:hypothetical protein
VDAAKQKATISTIVAWADVTGPLEGGHREFVRPEDGQYEQRPAISDAC